MQNTLVGLIVIACAFYAVWTLMPSALRRALAGRLQHGPWPEPLARALRRAAQRAPGCGCAAGCSAQAMPPSAPQPIRIHTRPKKG